MNLHSTDADILIAIPYASKLWLEDSFERTHKGFNQIKNEDLPYGIGNILLARVESAAACALVAFTSSIMTFVTAIAAPLGLCIIPLNLVSRLPGLSSHASMQNFTKQSSDALIRMAKVSLIIVPANLLFISIALVNTFVPTLLKADGLFTNALHDLVKTLGPLDRIRVIVGDRHVEGTLTKQDALSALEDSIRALSFKNRYREIKATHVNHIHTYTS